MGWRRTKFKSHLFCHVTKNQSRFECRPINKLEIWIDFLHFDMAKKIIFKLGSSLVHKIIQMQQFYCEQVEVKLFSTIFKYKHHLKCNLEFVVLYLDSYSQSFSRRVRNQALNLARFHNLLGSRTPAGHLRWEAELLHSAISI